MSDEVTAEILSTHILDLARSGKRLDGRSPDQYRAALARAIALGWLWLHESGTYVKFTEAGADLFA